MQKSAPSNPVELTATEIAERVAAGELTATEVAEAHIERIREVNERLNAVVIQLFDEALAAAAEADEAVARGVKPGPLHGVPITVKEQFSVAGTDTTIGLPSRAGKPYPEDGPLVARLRNAGAIILGKTNVLQLLAGWESDNPVYGRSANPWDLERTPGGSSGGEAAIIAARGVPLGLGGDLGGSIRIPAHFCGICGLKPTSWRLTNTDVPAGLLGTGQEAVIPQPGPMARSVTDLSLAMRVLARPDAPPDTDLVPPVPWREPGDIAVDELTVGVYTDHDLFPVSPAIRRAVDAAAEALRACGARVVPFEAPDAREAMRLLVGILSADGGESFRRALAGDRPHRLIAGLLRGGTAPAPLRGLAARIAAARSQEHFAFIARCMGRRSAAEFFRLVEERNAFRMGILESMNAASIDAFVCPPFALPAVRHGDSEHLPNAAGYSAIFNVTGMPAGVVPATVVRADEESDRGDSKDRALRTARAVEEGSAGLPVGVQVVGRHWREDVVLAVMAALEAHFRTRPDFPVRPPL